MQCGGAVSMLEVLSLSPAATKSWVQILSNACKRAHWFVSYQLGFLAVFCSIKTICFITTESLIRGEDNQVLYLSLSLLLLLLLLKMPTCQQWSELVEVPLLGQALIHPQEFWQFVLTEWNKSMFKHWWHEKYCKNVFKTTNQWWSSSSLHRGHYHQAS